jgi:hypothetical protein
MTARRHFGNKAPTKAAQRTALVSLLAMRRTLEGVDAASLSRSYGLPAAEVAALVEQERKRRGARG